MFVHTSENRQQTEGLFNTIETDLSNWQMISMRLYRRDGDLLDKLSSHLVGLYQGHTGVIFKVSDYKIIYFIRLGPVENHIALNSSLEKDLRGYELMVNSQKVTMDILKLHKNYVTQENAHPENEMYLQRLKRTENSVLIIDDDLFIRKVLCAGFEEYASVIDTAVSEDAVKLYKQENPDIVFIDIHMPGTGGFDMCQKILELDPDAYAILASSNSSIQNVTEAVSCGSVGFLAKPIRKEKLVEHARRCITFSINNSDNPKDSG